MLGHKLPILIWLVGDLIIPPLPKSCDLSRPLKGLLMYILYSSSSIGLQFSSNGCTYIWSRNMGYICTHVGYPRGSACEFFQRDTTNVTPEVKQGTMGITTIREQHNIYNTSDDKNMHQYRSE